ncbi:MAG: ABC transporter, partial [Cyanobacteria bacterium J06606_4]
GALIYDGLLDGLLEKFAPYREVSVELDRHQAIDRAALAAYGNLQTLEGCKATYLIPVGDLTQTVTDLLNTLKIQDLSIAEPPIEDVIGKVFETGKL